MPVVPTVRTRAASGENISPLAALHERQSSALLFSPVHHFSLSALMHRSMFNRKSSYALNKKDPNAIVYMDANEAIIRLTREDFASEEEFLKWKSLSDADYEHYLMGEIDLNTYKAEKAACNELLLKTKNAYAAVLAQAKQKQDEQARQDSRKEASKAIFDADTLTTELAELLIDRVLVYPDKRIEIAYKIQDIFD